MLITSLPLAEPVFAQIPHAAREPVQLGDNDRLDLPPLNHGQHALHARPAEGFCRFPTLLNHRNQLGAVYQGHGADLSGLAPPVKPLVRIADRWKRQACSHGTHLRQRTEVYRISAR